MFHSFEVTLDERNLLVDIKWRIKLIKLLFILLIYKLFKFIIYIKMLYPPILTIIIYYFIFSI